MWSILLPHHTINTPYTTTCTNGLPDDAHTHDVRNLQKTTRLELKH